MSQQPWPKQLEGLAELNHRLARLAQTALVLLRNDDLDGLDKLWRERGRVAADAAAAHARLGGVFANWEREVAALPLAQRESAVRLVEQVRANANQTLELDRQSIELIEGYKAETKAQMERMDTGRRLISAYGQANKPASVPLRVSTKG